MCASSQRDPAGATVVDDSEGNRGTTFRLDSSVAESVELCIFEGSSERRHEMDGRDGSFSLFLDGIAPGTEYGFRVHGPWDPGAGHRCNPAKLLIDPRARLIRGMPLRNEALLGHDPRDPSRPNELDSSAYTMRSVVTQSNFDWEHVRPPTTPMSSTVVYETHVRGISALNPDVPDDLRGTYAGLAHPATTGYLEQLGVTAVELLPVHQFIHEAFLQDQNKRNYWGYNSIGFFAPHAQYAATDNPIEEFKGMVKCLHAAGIEVILDVVYNHTAEGNHLGPTLSFRGIDNANSYRLDPSDRSRYLNWTGTGNTLDFSQPGVLQLAMDSLRMWVADYHVDGFRFDLATTLGRTWGQFDPLGGFFGAIAQDPILSSCKLIAEPWDVGPGGYQVGGYPRRWSEWNDKYRDQVRDFWRGRPASLGEFATRLTASSDVFGNRRPDASINFVTSHDGFTLSDLVSYDERHNEDNGEEGRDGHTDNRSWNSGVEGPTDNPKIQELRRRRVKSFLVTLMLSQGVPMLLGGDEIGRTQNGNNNAYNQDSPSTWYDWDGADLDLAAFVAKLVRLRRAHPTFRRTAWLHEHAEPGTDHVGWFAPDGSEMRPEDWNDPDAHSVALFLRGEGIHCDQGRVEDDDYLLLFNGGPDEVEFATPDAYTNRRWETEVDTTAAADPRSDVGFTVAPYGALVLRAVD